MIEPVDLASMIPAHLLAIPELVQLVVPDIAEAVRTEIIRLAGEELTSGGEDYIQAVQPVKYHFPSGRIPLTGDTAVASIVLVGWLANAFEHGWPGADLKPALLRGRNVKIGKDGQWYNTVPFRHGTLTASGANFALMGSQHARLGQMTTQAAESMGKRIHNFAKRLKPTTGHATTRTEWGGRLRAGMSPKLRPHHATDIHSGMVRSVQTYRKRNQSQYFTFRRVSERSDPAAFVHPGIEPHNFFKQGAGFAGQIAGRLFQVAVDGAMKGAQ